MVHGKQFVGSSVLELYKQIAPVLLKEGSVVSPRGKQTREILNAQIILTNPRNRLIYNERRNFNIFHALNEAVLLFSPTDRVEHIAEYNKNMALFSDDGETMHGAYGHRIAYDIVHIVRVLKEDPESRQAVLTIYDSSDMQANTKDVPCTASLQFLLRDGQLHLTVTMRSNDILYGFQFDVFMFTMLQETIANTLGVELGIYTHNPASLHVYQDGFSGMQGYEMLDELASERSINIEVRNNGQSRDWFHLAYVHTSNAKYNIEEYDHSKTTQEVQWLLNRERSYRNIKKATPIHGDIWNKEAWTRSYMNTPVWARPFIKKWNMGKPTS